MGRARKDAAGTGREMSGFYPLRFNPLSRKDYLKELFKEVSG